MAIDFLNNAQFSANGVLRVDIDSSGRKFLPNRPAFNAYIINGLINRFISGNQNITAAWTVVYNRGNHFNQANGTFTAPIAGYYAFSCMVSHDGNGDISDFGIAKNNGVFNEVFVTKNSTYGWTNGTQCVVVELAANDTVNMASVSYNTNTGNGRANFSGWLIG